MLAYFVFATVFTAITHAYFAVRWLAPLDRGSKQFRAVRAALLANALILPATLVWTLRAPASVAWLAVPVAHVAFGDVGFCLLLAFGLMVRDLPWAAWRLFRSARRGGDASDPTRRAALLEALNLTVGATALAGTGLGYVVAVGNPVLHRVRVPCARMPPEWRGLRVVQVSDLHVGPTIRRAYVESLVAAVNALEPDVIALTGDLVDGFVAQLASQIEPLRQLRARHGVFVVTGNHEYYYRAHEWLETFRTLGLRVLANDQVVVEHDGQRIAIAGVNDEAAIDSLDRPSLIRNTLAAAPTHDLALLLAHRPSDAPHAARLGIDVQLSGHLHAGQFAPLTWLVRRLEPFVAGLYRVGPLALYVNRGAGYWGPPNRLGAQQEITLLEIVAA